MPKKEPQKKRGRKPKGGKLVDAKDLPNLERDLVKPNIILHLKCFISDIGSVPKQENTVEAYNEPCHGLQFSSVHPQQDSHQLQSSSSQCALSSTPHGQNSGCNGNHGHSGHNDNPNQDNMSTSHMHDPTPDQTRQLVERLHELDKYLIHIQRNSDNIHNVVSHETIETMETHSACFWCTCGFTTPAIYLPKHEVNGRYEVYNCFCSPECAVGYLFEESIDQSVKWERYALFNYLYKPVFEQDKPFYPAPNPRFLLKKYFGTLTIEEYRALLRSGKHVMVIDKPISKVYPEIHVDNHEFEEMSGIRGKRKMRLSAPNHVKQKNSKSKKKSVENIFGLQQVK